MWVRLAILVLLLRVARGDSWIYANDQSITYSGQWAYENETIVTYSAAASLQIDFMGASIEIDTNGPYGNFYITIDGDVHYIGASAEMGKTKVQGPFKMARDNVVHNAVIRCLDTRLGFLKAFIRTSSNTTPTDYFPAPPDASKADPPSTQNQKNQQQSTSKAQPSTSSTNSTSTSTSPSESSSAAGAIAVKAGSTGSVHALPAANIFNSSIATPSSLQISGPLPSNAPLSTSIVQVEDASSPHAASDNHTKTTIIAAVAGSTGGLLALLALFFVLRRKYKDRQDVQLFFDSSSKIHPFDLDAAALSPRVSDKVYPVDLVLETAQTNAPTDSVPRWSNFRDSVDTFSTWEAETLPETATQASTELSPSPFGRISRYNDRVSYFPEPSVNDAPEALRPNISHFSSSTSLSAPPPASLQAGPQSRFPSVESSNRSSAGGMGQLNDAPSLARPPKAVAFVRGVEGSLDARSTSSSSDRAYALRTADPFRRADPPIPHDSMRALFFVSSSNPDAVVHFGVAH